MEVRTKEQLIKDFTRMKDLEKSAEEMYFKIASDPEVHDEEIKNNFKRIADDEKRHSELVQRILNIINNNL